jgi:hypothetical protein
MAYRSENPYWEKKRAKDRLSRMRTLKKLSKTIFVWAVVMFFVLFFGASSLVSIFSRKVLRGTPPAASDTAAGRVYPDQGRAHIAVGADHPAYNSNPPTSGWHYEQAAKWGVYDTELPDEQLVHNLEHCGIWISYRPDIPDEERAKIIEFAKRFPTKVIVTPREKNDSPIALAAWTRLLTMETFNERDALTFTVRHLNRAGPECEAE